ncbi:MAG: class I SAM-dependent methyltransferase [Methylomicrobium sp.]
MDSKSLDLQLEYKNRFQDNSTYRDSVWKILCQSFFSKYIDRSSVLLDVGAGWGEFSRNIEAKKKYAIDLNPDCGKRVEGYATFFHQDCSSTWPLEDEALDVVFTSNFLEHLPNKQLIDKTFSEAFRCLKSGGLIICVGPNIKYLPGLYWDYWDHYIPITDGSLSEALELRGFKIQEKIQKFLPYTMSGGKNPPLFSVRLYLKIPVLWRLFGKQFFIVAKKP